MRQNNGENHGPKALYASKIDYKYLLFVTGLFSLFIQAAGKITPFNFELDGNSFTFFGDNLKNGTSARAFHSIRDLILNGRFGNATEIFDGLNVTDFPLWARKICGNLLQLNSSSSNFSSPLEADFNNSFNPIADQYNKKCPQKGIPEIATAFIVLTGFIAFGVSLFYCLRWYEKSTPCYKKDEEWSKVYDEIPEKKSSSTVTEPEANSTTSTELEEKNFNSFQSDSLKP